HGRPWRRRCQSPFRGRNLLQVQDVEYVSLPNTVGMGRNYSSMCCRPWPHACRRQSEWRERSRRGLDEMMGSSARLEARHARRSVGRKLMLMALITTAIALLVAGVSLLTRELHAYRIGLGSDLQSEAGILALSTAPALAFGDHATATRNVEALSARPAVLAVAIYGAHGRLFAQYVRAGESPPPPTAPRVAGGLQFRDDRIEIAHP